MITIPKAILVSIIFGNEMKLYLKFFLTLVAVFLFTWIFYVIYQLTSWKNSLEPSKIFSIKDEQVLVVHKPSGFEWSQFEFTTLHENRNLINPLLSNLASGNKVYISKKRNIILVESSVGWTDSDLKRVLTKSNLRFSKIRDGELKIEQYKALLKNNRLLIYKYDEDIEGSDFDWSQLDRNASASLVRFQKSKIDFIDIFIKNENTIEYHSRNAGKIKGKLIDDLSIFQSYVPVKSSGYQFFEKTYLASIDPVFRKSPIYKFLNDGIVSFAFEGKPVLLCNFVEGQNLVQNLNEYFQRQEDNSLIGKFDNLSISQKISSSRLNSYFISTIDNVAIITLDEDVNKLILDEIGLSKTWLYNEEELEKNNKNLPKLVSHRSFNKLKNSTISVLGDKIIQTEVKYRSEKLQLNTDLEYISILISSKILDFESFNGRGNLVCLTDKGELVGIENGIKTWKKNMNDTPVGGLQVLKNNEAEYIIATGTKSIHILDRYGKYLDAFPIQLEKSKITCQANAYMNKGELFVGFLNDKNQISIVNSKGKTNRSFQLKEIIDCDKIDFFISKSNIHFIIGGLNQANVYNLDEKSLVKKITGGSNYQICDYPNSTILYYLKNGGIKQWQFSDGEIEDNDKESDGQFLDRIVNSKYVDSTLYTIAMKGSKLFTVKNNRSLIFEKEFGGTSPLTGDIFINNFNELYFSIVAGIENGLYLYDSKGRLYVKGMIEGSNKVVLNQSPGYSLTLTTVVNGYLVQYFLK